MFCIWGIDKINKFKSDKLRFEKVQARTSCWVRYENQPRVDNIFQKWKWMQKQDFQQQTTVKLFHRNSHWRKEIWDRYRLAKDVHVQSRYK